MTAISLKGKRRCAIPVSIVGFFLSEYSVSPETNSWIGLIDFWSFKYPEIEINLLLLFWFVVFKVRYLLLMKLLHVKILLFPKFYFLDRHVLNIFIPACTTSKNSQCCTDFKWILSTLYEFLSRTKVCEKSVNVLTSIIIIKNSTAVIC